ncbi:MAG: hypothetical protein IKK39_16190 [Thermoguttaceae bacterium]|nr:hypothetical protein [Thermoguttaceae bacterium]
MRNDLSKMSRTRRLRLALALTAPTLLATASWAISDAAAEESNPIRQAVAVEASGNGASESAKIVQTAAQTPISSETGARLGAAGRKTGERTKGGRLAEELENLPNLGVRAVDETEVEHAPHGASLFDVMPGTTKYADLKKNPILAKPVAEEVVDGYEVATYQPPTLPDTTIQIVGIKGVVEAIMINLSEPRTETDARKVFAEEIKDSRPILVPDEIGNFREVFPEKGVAFVLEKGDNPAIPSDRVVQIVAETVKAEYFILRAEQELKTSLKNARDDAEHALLHEKNSPGAHWILAKTHLAVGDFANARRHIFQAIKLNDSMAQFHLTLIDALIQSGEIDAASRYMEAVEDAFVEHPLYQIEGVLLGSALKREAAEPDYDGAISLGQSALKMLKTLGEANPTADVIEAGKALEMRANLAVALAVARKSWKDPSDQEKAFEWIEAADEIAKEIDAARGEKSELASARLEVWRTGLEVGLEMPDATQLDQYARDLRSTVDKYLAKTLDEVSAASARWTAGQALANAAKIFEARKDYQQAIISGRKALEYLEVALQFRPETDRAIVGVLNARLGTDFLNGLKNAKEASAHFAKADALFKKIEGEVKPKDAAEIGAQLAAVGAIYWKSGKKEEGVAMLKRSVAVLARAVEAGVVDKTALYVPYANLATMSKALKNAADAAKYAKLAEACAPKK